MRFIYDLTTQPFSIGDVLTASEMATVLMEERGHDSIDFVFAYDPSRPAIQVSAFNHITPDNFWHHFRDLVDASYANSHVSNSELIDIRQIDYTDSWPTEKTGYLYYDMMRHICEFHRKNGRIPQMECSQSSFADQFGEYISIQLRKNPRANSRDSNFGAWSEFLRSRREHFVIVGWADEIDERLRLPNVTIAKDMGTTVAQDLAIVAGSTIHMGAASGPIGMKMFSQKPFVAFNCATQPHTGFGYDGTRGRYEFFNEKQSFLLDVETPELINSEFERLVS